ncbi:MAG: FKBP-type peptidyl-prolyl cis-trans isomerase [Bacteroides sp.]|nr:FKBP-type peptidyl-prolyl cis-trans isomerase [Bacteroides sp.]MCM1413777.1 FKBP-type peptidyl-prolyl cis-trans isomerase [Bacteroides sp.]MCM1472204.1 FKBP-type peptidyl-prolyl cis-trans isomerase [Bacteroides sp.]
MKKLLIAVVAAIACSPLAGAQNPDADSLGYYIGATQGAMFNHMIASEQPQANQEAYKKEFLDGLASTLLADTSRAAFRRGQTVGLNIIDELGKMNVAGQTANLQKLYDAFAQLLGQSDVTEQQYRVFYENLARLMEPTRTYYQQQQDARRAEAERAQRESVETNIKAGDEFMARLKANNKNIVTTPSGLVYEVNKKGTGPTLAEGQDAMVRYTGRLVDGTQFDSSGDKAIRFNPNQVIKGFGEGLRLMNKGSKYTFYIPYQLAYGMQGPPAIGPAQTLIFEVECVDILPEK